MGLKGAVFSLINHVGIPVGWRALHRRNQVTILCYHDPAPEMMARHLEWLCKRYNLIALEDYFAWRQGRISELPPHALVITLDDGHAGNAKLVEVFRHHGAKPTIFLCSDIVGTHRHYWWQAVASESARQQLKRLPDAERLKALQETGFAETREYADRSALSSDEIGAMRETVDFQAHTQLHSVLPMCGDQRARDEISGCRRSLAERFGLATWAFAYPNGDYCDRDVGFVREAGFGCALTIDAGFNDAKTDMFRLKRILIPDNAGLDELAVKASGFWNFLMRLAGKKPPFGYHIRHEN